MFFLFLFSLYHTHSDFGFNSAQVDLFNVYKRIESAIERVTAAAVIAICSSNLWRSMGDCSITECCRIEVETME